MKRYLSAKYVEQFRCDGAACGARCCRGWAIGLTSQDRKRLEGGLSQAPLKLRSKKDAVEPNVVNSSNHVHPFRIRFNEQGVCPYLQSDLMCEVHATLGAPVLADLCAQYPREVGVLGDQSEMWATLACPEAARLCLFSEEGADLVELVDVPGLRHVNNLLEISGATPDYQAYLDEVRRHVIGLLSLKQYPLRSRLLAVAYLGHRTASYFHDKANSVERRRLLADMNTVLGPAFLVGLGKELDSNSVPGNYAMALISSVVQTDLTASSLTNQVGNVPAAASNNSPDFTTEVWLQNWMDFCLKRQRWEKDFAPIVDLAFENYSKVFWLKDWFVYSPNLLVHAVACVLRIAVMRFQLFNQLALQQNVESQSLQERQKLLEKALLDIVTDTTRIIDHDRAFRRSLHEALAKRGMEDLAHAGILLMI
jgi:lysine-N-methylase